MPRAVVRISNSRIAQIVAYEKMVIKLWLKQIVRAS